MTTTRNFRTLEAAEAELTLELCRDLLDIRADARTYSADEIGDGIQFRVYVTTERADDPDDDGYSYRVCTGSPDHYTDPRVYCACGTVGPDDDEMDLRRLAGYLVAEILDTASMDDDDDDVSDDDDDDDDDEWTGSDIVVPTGSGYCHCACRDCPDVAMTDVRPDGVHVRGLCGDCDDATCDPTGSDDCQRSDAYGVETPNCGDYVISCNGFRYHVGVCEGPHVGTFGDVDDADNAVRSHRATTSPEFWPDVWRVSDHGNVDVVDDFDWTLPSDPTDDDDDDDDDGET